MQAHRAQLIARNQTDKVQLLSKLERKFSIQASLASFQRKSRRKKAFSAQKLLGCIFKEN